MSCATMILPKQMHCSIALQQRGRECWKELLTLPDARNLEIPSGHST